MTAKPALPRDAQAIRLRYIATRPVADPCWRIEVLPSATCPDGLSLEVHGAIFVAATTERHDARGSVAAHGHLSWQDRADDALWLLVDR